MKKYNLLAFLGLFLLSLLAGGCTTTVQLTMTRPAEINLNHVKVIAIADFDGGKSNHARDLAGKFTTVLSDSGYFKSVLDRQNLSGIMKEQDLGFTGFVDDENVVRIGKFIGAAVLVFGRITADEYKENTKTETVKVYDSEKKVNINVTRKTRSGEYSVSIQVQVTDAESARILGSRNFTAKHSDTTEADNSQPASIDQNELYQNVSDQLTERFKKFIVPYQESVPVYLEIDGKLPEVDTAAKLLGAGETDQALDLLSEATQRQYSEQAIKAKALYNYGIVLVYAGRFEPGIGSINAALRLNPSNQMYAEALILAKKERQNAQKLKEQLERS